MSPTLPELESRETSLFENLARTSESAQLGLRGFSRVSTAREGVVVEKVMSALAIFEGTQLPDGGEVCKQGSSSISGAEGKKN